MSQVQLGEEFSIICFHCEEITCQHYIRSKTYQIKIDGQDIEMVDSWYFCIQCRRENKVEDI